MSNQASNRIEIQRSPLSVTVGDTKYSTNLVLPYVPQSTWGAASDSFFGQLGPENRILAFYILTFRQILKEIDEQKRLPDKISTFRIHWKRSFSVHSIFYEKNPLGIGDEEVAGIAEAYEERLRAEFEWNPIRGRYCVEDEGFVDGNTSEHQDHGNTRKRYFQFDLMPFTELKRSLGIPVERGFSIDEEKQAWQIGIYNKCLEKFEAEGQDAGELLLGATFREPKVGLSMTQKEYLNCRDAFYTRWFRVDSQVADNLRADGQDTADFWNDHQRIWKKIFLKELERAAEGDRGDEAQAFYRVLYFEANYLFHKFSDHLHRKIYKEIREQLTSQERNAFRLLFFGRWIGSEREPQNYRVPIEDQILLDFFFGTDPLTQALIILGPIFGIKELDGNNITDQLASRFKGYLQINQYWQFEATQRETWERGQRHHWGQEKEDIFDKDLRGDLRVSETLSKDQLEECSDAVHRYNIKRRRAIPGDELLSSEDGEFLSSAWERDPEINREAIQDQARPHDPPAQNTEILNRVMKTLSETEREIFLGRYVKGKSIEGLAQERGVSKNAISSMLSTAKTKLVKSLAESGISEENIRNIFYK